MKTKWTQSLLVRLTLMLSLSTFVVLVVLGKAVTHIVGVHFMEMDHNRLQQDMKMVLHDFHVMDTNQEPLRQINTIFAKHGVLAAVLGADGRILASSPGMSAHNIKALWGTEKLSLHWVNDAGSYQGLSGSFQTNHPGLPGGDIVLALDISEHMAFLTAFHHFLWPVIGIAALFMGFLGWFAARMVLSPFRRLIAGVGGVSTEKLDLRFAIADIPLELKEPERMLNTMLERLETSFMRLTHFSADLAHELRTPLNTMRVQTQVALAHDRTADDYKDILQSNAEELERLSRMVNDMLFLAKTENGLELSHAEQIDLAAEIEKLFEFYGVLAEERDIHLELEGQGTQTGDRQMLRRALGNLLTNAISYGTPGSAVRVVLEQTAAEKNRIIVVSHGETVTLEHLPRLFDRFYRADSSRQHAKDGVGLGLAITRSIIQAHDGMITAHSEQGTTRFIVELPHTLPAASTPIT